MSRQRMIRPEFFTDAELGDLPPTTRLLFIGMWTLADRDGRLRDRPRDIKRALLPTDQFNAEEAIQQLANIGSIRRYEVDGGHYIDIPGFVTYQHVHPHEAPSTLPPFKFSRAKKPANSREAVTLHGEPRNVSTCPCTSTSTSTSTEDLKPLSPCGDSENEETPSQELEVLEGDVVEDDLFEDLFWPAWPNKHGSKKTAKARFNAATALDQQRILIAEGYLIATIADGRYEMEFLPRAENFVGGQKSFFEEWAEGPPAKYCRGNGGPSKKQRDIDRSITRAMNSIDWPEEDS